MGGILKKMESEHIKLKLVGYLVILPLIAMMSLVVVPFIKLHDLITGYKENIYE